MLELKNIHKTYEGKPLLSGISFTVQPGETVCLLGSSGSGKSTLLRIISGLESAEQGEVLWNGEYIARIPVYLRNFGLMFQEYALFPHKSVQANIAFGLEMQKMPRNEINRRVAEVMEKVKMTGFENRRVTDLSGGEQQRVALARTLAPNPRLLMFDEPLGALDRALREHLILELRDILAEMQVPAIYVTHDQQEAFAIAHKVMLLHEGFIVQSGTPDEVRANPANAWVADFLGVQNSNPITIIKRNASGAETWRYTGKVLQRESGQVVVEAFFNHDDVPIVDTTLKRGDRFVETFYTDHWYNIFEIYDRDDGRLKGWYCNIAKPAMLESVSAAGPGQKSVLTLSYIDLALDLWVNPRRDMTVLDEDEFGALHLEPETHQKALSALEELKTRFHTSGS